MKPGVLCLLLMSGCSFLWGPEEPPVVEEYALTWTCRSPEGCERADELRRIDRVFVTDYRYLRFTSTYDESYEMEAEFSLAPSLPPGCAWVYFLTFFGHELERSMRCTVPSGFELEFSIPNEDPTTHSMWRVEALDVNIF
jgi:hypothetical protein